MSCGNSWRRARRLEAPIITRYRSAFQNIRGAFQAIIRRAGLEEWPKLFQNLRSTRETELAEQFPIHVVCVLVGKYAGGGEKTLPADHRRALRQKRRKNRRSMQR